MVIIDDLNMQIRRIKNRLCPKKYRVSELTQFLDKNDKSLFFDLIEVTTEAEVKQYIDL